MTMQTFTPLQYLKIDIAGSYGLDKESWDDRISWFDLHEEELLSLISMKSASSKMGIVQNADSPALLLAGVQAYAAAKRGEPIAFPISLDATASGAQLLACLIGCEMSARACNVLDTGAREDLYTNVYHEMLDRAGIDSKDAVITRTDAKSAVMTSLYGSKAQPKKIFGEGKQLMNFYETMEESFTGIWNLNQSLLELWQSDALSHDWVLPDNFHVKTKVMDNRTEYVQFLGRPVEVHTKVNRPTETGLSIGANVVHSLDGMVVREISRRCSYDVNAIGLLIHMLKTDNYVQNRTHTGRPQDKLVIKLWHHYEQTGFLSARILENLDQENLYLVDTDVIGSLIATLPMTPFEVLSTHDCFRVHPNYANDLRRQYNQVLSEIAASDILGDIASQIIGSRVQVNKYANISSGILEANYALS